MHIAEAVAEFVIAQIMEHLRFPTRQDMETKAGTDWVPSRERFVGRLLGAQTVGIVGAGHTGRLVIKLLRPFGCRILVADPYVSDQQARELGVEIRALDELMSRSDIVSLHAPVPPESPLRSAPGVILSPHTAGHTWDTYRRQGQTTIAEVRRFLTGEPLQHEVTQQMLATMA